MRKLFSSLVLLAQLGPSFAQGAFNQVLDPDTFTAEVAKLYSAADRSFKVRVVGPLELSIKTPNGPQKVYLKTLYSACLRDRTTCAEQVSRNVAALSASYLAVDEPIRAAELRVTVRPSVYVDQISATGHDPIAEPLVDDLWVILVRDQPTTIITVNETGLAQLGMDEDEALAAGKRNLQARFTDLIAEALQQNKVGPIVTRGDEYSASFLAMPELWAPLAKKFDGHLYVAAPGDQIVAFVDAREPNAKDEMLELVEIEGGKAHRQISPAVFAWTPRGWTVVAKATKSQL